ncbi:hypothetical protein DSO57_1008460 [Entomophthora muscae]|uniref:Uncharacterized protein n=1 Tax=Entomophthora muscae TaxID=34485 RepID=A0ACC2U4T7_9FUNG|nr:hypothetical protein DSO57_1008460 [Entomophthora muscae]
MLRKKAVALGEKGNLELHDIDRIIHNYKALDSDLQEMREIIKNMDEHFSLLIVQAQELSLQFTGVFATAAVQQIQIDDVL